MTHPATNSSICHSSSYQFIYPPLINSSIHHSSIHLSTTHQFIYPPLIQLSIHLSITHPAIIHLSTTHPAINSSIHDSSSYQFIYPPPIQLPIHLSTTHPAINSSIRHSSSYQFIYPHTWSSLISLWSWWTLSSYWAKPSCSTAIDKRSWVTLYKDSKKSFSVLCSHRVRFTGLINKLPG